VAACLPIESRVSISSSALNLPPPNAVPSHPLTRMPVAYHLSAITLTEAASQSRTGPTQEPSDKEAEALIKELGDLPPDAIPAGQPSIGFRIDRSRPERSLSAVGEPAKIVARVPVQSLLPMGCSSGAVAGRSASAARLTR
jgi:hypothetical protein